MPLCNQLIDSMQIEEKNMQKASLPSWRDFARECFCFGGEAVNAIGEAARRLVRSRVELCVRQCTRVLDWLRVRKRQLDINGTSHLSQGTNVSVCVTICKMKNAE